MSKINLIGDIALFPIYSIENINPFKYTTDLLNDSDILAGNFEFPFTDCLKAEKLGASRNYAAPVDMAKIFHEVNFDVLSLANNHTMDWGVEGFETTRKILDKHGIKTFGAGLDNKESREPVIIEKQNKKYAFLGYCKKGSYSSQNGKPGVSPIDEDFIIEEITTLRNRVDYILVSMHWGTEFVNYPDPKDVQLGHRLIEAGADVIWGHHPHVVQGYENYNNGLIIYSLGSFIYAPSQEEVKTNKKIQERKKSLIGSVTFKQNNISFEYIPCKLNEENIPVPLEGEDRSDFDSRMIYYSENIYNSDLYYSEAGDALFKREFLTYLKLFRTNPLRTIIYFIKQFKLKYFVIIYKKLMNR
jgi:poly-gamma-glutamate synthesis protein (capsule biosynthesis protein)